MKERVAKPQKQLLNTLITVSFNKKFKKIAKTQKQLSNTLIPVSFSKKIKKIDTCKCSMEEPTP